MSVSEAQGDRRLPELYKDTLLSIQPFFHDENMSSKSAQDILSTAADELHLIRRMLSSLGAYSDNEGIEELGELELAFLSVAWVSGEVEASMGIEGPLQRSEALQRAKASYSSFLSLLITYGIIQRGQTPELSLEDVATPASLNPSFRRQEKIRQYREEQQLRDQISTSLLGAPHPSTSPIKFIIAIMDTATGRRTAQNAESSSHLAAEDDQSRRKSIILLLRLLSLLTHSSIVSNDTEARLIAAHLRDSTGRGDNEEQSSFTDERRKQRSSSHDDLWRIETPSGRPHNTRLDQLISRAGDVLQPFTILPSTSGSTHRGRLMEEVFKNSHRLPTMTIDQYLELEQERGNVLTGGGPQSAQHSTPKALRSLRAQDDGTMEGDTANEAARSSEEQWAAFTDEHKRGSGNTINRG